MNKTQFVDHKSTNGFGSSHEYVIDFQIEWQLQVI